MAQSIDLHVFIDAFGWRIIDGRDFLADVAPYRKPLRTVLGYSCAAVPSILTGCSPAELGRLSFYYHDPAGSPFRGVSRALRLLPGFAADRGRLRRHISRVVGKWLGFTGYFQLYNVPFQHLGLFSTCETSDIFADGGLSPCRSIFDHLREQHVPFHCSDWRATEEPNLIAAEQAAADPDNEWAFVYLPGLDGLMHAVGTKHGSVDDKLAFYEGWIRRIWKAASQSHEHVRLTVVSDHGMTNVVEHCDVAREIDSLGLRFGTDYVAFYDSTMARFWYLRSGARAAIEGRLRELPYGSVLDREQLEQFGAHFPDDRFGETIFLADPGWLVVPSFMSRVGLAAMHGYSPDDADADAMMACSEPIGAEVGAITDVYGHMTGMLSDACVDGELAFSGQ